MSGNRVKAKRILPVPPAPDEMARTKSEINSVDQRLANTQALDNNCIFEDSFCNLDVLDGVCEAETEYTNIRVKRSPQGVPSASHQFKTHSSKRNELVEGPLHNAQSLLNNATHKRTCNENQLSSNRTNSSDLRRSPRLKKPTSDSAKKQKHDTTSKEFAKHNVNVKQKENVVATAVGADTLEAIDAMDLDDSLFPDEITSPVDEIQREERLGCAVQRKSQVHNHNENSGHYVNFSYSETVRRSQRLRIKNSKSKTDSTGSSDIKNSNENATVKVYDQRIFYSNCKSNIGNGCTIGTDSASNVNLNFQEDSSNCEAYKERQRNSLSGMSTSLNNAAQHKSNNTLENKKDLVRPKINHKKEFRNSSDSVKKMSTIKDEKSMIEVFADVFATGLPLEQSKQLQCGKNNKSESIREAARHNSLFDSYLEDGSPGSDKQLDKGVKQNDELPTRQKQQTLDATEKRQSCSDIPKAKNGEHVGPQIQVAGPQTQVAGPQIQVADPQTQVAGPQIQGAGLQTQEDGKIVNSKILHAFVKPGTTVESFTPAKMYNSALVMFDNSNNPLTHVNTEAHITVQICDKVNKSNETRVQVISGESVEIPALVNPPSKENDALYRKEFMRGEAKMPVKSRSADEVKSTKKDIEMLVICAKAKPETPVQFHNSKSPKSEKGEVCLRSPFSENNKTQSFLTTQEKMELSSWGLPDAVLECYLKNGIKTMFPWQAECLSLPEVLDGRNLVYSAPTSAGKTLVAELLLLKRVVENGRKGMFVLPFVSVAREKMYYLQKMFSVAGVRVEGFMGSQGPPGGLKATDIAVCTIEKANNLVNRLLEDKRLNELGIIVVDELHMLGDSHRGYLLELLLTKVMFVSRHSCSGKKDENSIQIIGMSATLPNLELLACWLDSRLYKTDFRPVPLTERVKIGRAVCDSTMSTVRELDPLLTVKGDSDHLIQLCLETVLEGYSVLVFCPTKAWCEKLAESVAKAFFRIGKTDSQYPMKLSRKLRDSLDSVGIGRVMEALRKCPVSLDAVLARSISFGAAFHHAGLTFDERDIIEGGFRTGSIRVLIATSTLSSGVNLPARRVIIRSPVFGRSILDTLTYKQMIGRAGRKGVDTEGESILICREEEKQKARTLMSSTLPPITSCLQHDASLTSSMKRAILEVIVSGVATTPDKVDGYCRCTLLATSLNTDASHSQPDTPSSISTCIAFLEENEFIRLQDTDGAVKYIGTQLGLAVLASGLSPDEGLHVFTELHRARQCFVLENDLHIIYQVTPIYVSSAWLSLDWLTFLDIWERLGDNMKRVGELVGIEEVFIVRAMKGLINKRLKSNAKQLAIHQRFYTALALHELVQEVPLNTVAEKYGACRGMLQSLQQSAASFAGMVTVFCNRLGWHNMELLLAQFHDRLHFGIQRELCDLVRLSYLNGQRARVLYNAGLETVKMLAHASPQDIENILLSTAPFQSNKMETQQEGTIWLSSGRPLTEGQAADLIVDEARQLVQKDLGIASIDWTRETKGIITPGRKPSTGTHGSTSANRTSCITRRRSSISPNPILQPEAARRKDSINGAVTPVIETKARKRISPLILALRRKSKSPKIIIDTKKMTINASSEQCMQDEINLKSCSTRGEPDKLEDNLRDHDGAGTTAEPLHRTTGAAKSVKENGTVFTSVNGNVGTDEGINTVFENGKTVSETGKSNNVVPADQTGNKPSNDKNKEKENKSEKRERKDTKGKAKNRKREVKDTRKSNDEYKLKVSRNADIAEDKENFDSNGPTNQSSGNYAKNIFKEKSTIVGLLFGKPKVREEAVRMDKENTSFWIPESQEDKSDNVFTPKRPKIFGLKYNNLKAVQEFTNKTNSSLKETTKTEQQKHCLRPCEQSVVPEIKITPVQDNGSQLDGDHSNGMDTNTPIDDKPKKMLKVSATTPITNTAAKLITSPTQTPAGIINDAVAISASEDFPTFDISCFDEHVQKVEEMIKDKERNVFNEKNGRDSSKDFVNTSLSCISKKAVTKGSKTESSDIETKYLCSVTQKNYSNVSIDLLSDSQKDNLLRMLDSQDFYFGSENVCVLQEGVIHKESIRPTEIKNRPTHNVEPNTKGDRREQGTVMLKTKFEAHKTGPIKSNPGVPAGKCTSNQNCRANKSESLIQYKRRSPVDSFSPQKKSRLDEIVNKDILNMSTEVLNNRQDEKSIIHQVCPKDFDFSLIQDIESDKEKEINAVDGSYLQTVSKQKCLLVNVQPDISRDRAELNSSICPSCSKNEDSYSKNQTAEVLNQNFCEVKELELDDKGDTKEDETLSDSFLDRAFESYLYLSSPGEELLHHNQPQPVQQVIEENINDQPEGNVNINGRSREPNKDKNFHKQQEETGNNDTDVKSVHVLRTNSFSHSFTQLDITPGTEALLEGGMKDDHGVLMENELQLELNKVNPSQKNKGRLSDDIFGTPVSPISICSQRKASDVKSNITENTKKNKALSSSNQGVGVTTHKVFHSTKDNYSERSKPVGMDTDVSNDLPSMTNSFCIIDVVNDTRLFKSFMKEWEEQEIYAVGLACEKIAAQGSKGGIGWRITGQGRTRRQSQRSQEIAGLVVENSDLLIVGMAVCWGGRDAYYINLRTTQEDAFSSSLSTPPLQGAVSFENRVDSIKNSLLREREKTPILRVWDAKNCMKLLAAAGLGFILNPTEDPRVASWMLDPGEKELNIYNLVMNYSAESLPLLEGVGSSWGLASLGVNTNNPGSCRVRAATESVVVYHLMAALRVQLQELGMLQSFEDVEMPCVQTLACMELNGMGFNIQECEAQKSIMQSRMSSLERDAYSAVGHPFSLTSPDEISQVLYGELHLPSPVGPAAAAVRGRRGHSKIGGRGSRLSGPTNKDALEKLSKVHPLPSLILQWRKINSSLTKVVFPLQQACVYSHRLAMDRIHTQTYSFTATGRITMHEPNLQNIPRDFSIQVAADHTRERIGASKQQQHAQVNSGIMCQLAPLLTGEEEHTVSLRHALVAQSGSVLLAADYSQVELRLLAHLASDNKLLHLLNSGEDVFTTIAAQINTTNSEDVTVDQRQQAKQICYGMIYGMGAQALSEQLNVEEAEALSFMDKFKRRFPGVQQFMQGTLEKCRKKGYVLTLLGRRRYLPNITNQNVHARAQSERQAVNTVIQGSAADLVKLAMVRISTTLQQTFPTAPTYLTQPTNRRQQICGAFLVLQLHDELMYEVVSEDVIQVAQLVQSHMEGVQQLAVSLPVKIKVGPSWGAMKTLNL
ncbi:DNA polymerase theta-like isoform X2 [Homarus americanus]|uniref:DNA polymerase theta-like isoform X2 n=1 Tax=Homarus americanus TaxID=6706 RepID=UPI001C48CAEA|nr:DNA polymerase theta-like isoform X2 [Homarus americanus]